MRKNRCIRIIAGFVLAVCLLFQHRSVVNAQQDEEKEIHGIYVSAYVAGTKNMMDEIIEHIDETSINAVVIDVKNDEGRVTSFLSK